MKRKQTNEAHFMSAWLTKKPVCTTSESVDNGENENLKDNTSCSNTQTEVNLDVTLPSLNDEIEARSSNNLETPPPSPALTNTHSPTKESNPVLEDKVIPGEKPKPFQSKVPPAQTANGRNYNFSVNWYRTFPWLHYKVGSGSVVCFTCMTAKEKDLFSSNSQLKDTFITNGFTNWKDGKQRFEIHERSQQHQEAVLKINAQSKTSIDKAMELVNCQTQRKNREALTKIFSSLQFLGRQGIAIQGHDNDTGNFKELLKVRSSDAPYLKEWLGRPKQFTSSEIQNEICGMFAHHILRQVTNEIRSAQFFSLIVDETTDISTKEQVSICLRYVDNTLKPQERFLGLYETASTTGESLTQLITDALLRFDLSITKLRGQCYDGAANMKGKLVGVQTKIKEKEPRALYVHCYNHSLNLALQDASKTIPQIRDCLNYTHEVSVMISRSAKRMSMYLENQDETQNQKLKPICPTRWTVRCASIKAILSNYEPTLKTLEDLSSLVDKNATKANGLLTYFQKAESLLFLLICKSVFEPCETLSCMMQKPGVTLNTCVKAANAVITELLERKSDPFFKSLWSEMLILADKLELDPPMLPRIKRLPTRFRHGDTQNLPAEKSVEEHFFKIHVDLIEGLIAEISSRFKQKDVDEILQLEEMITNPSFNFEENLSESTCKKFGLDVSSLKLQISMFRKLEPTFTTAANAAELFALRHQDVKYLLPELQTLLELLLVIPASTATAERSFSMLRRLKSYLRSTMSQERLNHLAVMNVYQDELDSLEMNALINEFVNRNSYRVLQFGKDI